MTEASAKSAAKSGTLTVAAGFRGAAADATARLRTALAAGGVIATADPGRVRGLAAALGIPLTGRVLAGAGKPPAGLVPEVLAELVAGRDVLLVADSWPADAGDPCPGLIAAAVQAGVPVDVLPGPSAVIAALAVSGLAAERFAVEGVPPRDDQERERRFAELAADQRTLIFVAPARRAARTLAELAAAFGADRRAAVCAGLPAAAEDVLRGTLGEVSGQFGRAVQGEVTVVVAGAPVPSRAARERGTTAMAGAGAPDALHDAVARVRAQVRDGVTTRDAVAAVAAQTGVRKRDLYNAVGSSRPAAADPLDADPADTRR